LVFNLYFLILILLREEVARKRQRQKIGWFTPGGKHPRGELNPSSDRLRCLGSLGRCLLILVQLFR
jgi:hypothetical protein